MSGVPTDGATSRGGGTRQFPVGDDGDRAYCGDPWEKSETGKMVALARVEHWIS
jgi:hypothetical protein